MGYRFRAGEGGALVLQVHVPQSHISYYDREPKWRDATVEDIPVNDPFRRDDLRCEPYGPLFNGVSPEMGR